MAFDVVPCHDSPMNTKSTAAATTPAAKTAAAKREVREALKFAGFRANVTASSTWINVRVTDAADREAVLKMYPDAAPSEWDDRTLYITR